VNGVIAIGGLDIARPLTLEKVLKFGAVGATYEFRDLSKPKLTRDTQDAIAQIIDELKSKNQLNGDKTILNHCNLLFYRTAKITRKH